MITNLSISGLKGQNREHELGALTLLKGPNGSGKTATLQALMIAFLGYEPRLGKRPEATMTLAADSRLSVEVLTDKGFGVARHFSFDPAKGAVSQEIRLRGRSEMSQKEAEAEIAANLGNFPVMFDLAEFTSMSPDKQRDFIFHLSPLDAREWNAASLLARITFRALVAALGEGVAAEALKLKGGGAFAAFEKMTDKRRRAANELLTAKLDPAYAAALGEILEEIKAHCSEDVQSSLAGVLAALRGRARSARAKKAECASAVRALTEERAKHADAAAGVDETRAALAAAETGLAALAKTAGADDEKRKETARRSAEIAEAVRNKRERIREIENKPIPDIAALRAAAEKVARRIVDIPDAASLAAELQAISEEMETQSKRRDRILTAVTTIREKVENTVAAGEAISATIRQFRDGRCPTCGAPATSAHISAMLEAKTKEMERLVACMEEHRRALTAESRTLDRHEHEMETLAMRKVDIEQRVVTALETAHAKERELSDLEKRFSLASQERKHRAETVAALEAEIARLESSLAEIPAAEAGPEDTRVEERRGEIARMRAALAEQEKASSLVEAISARIAMARKGAAEHEVVRDLTGAAKAVRDGLVAEIIGPLQETVDEILPEIKSDYRSYFSLTDARGRETFEFGRQRGAQNIPFASLSGGETVLFSAALVTALIARACPPEKTLLVEMGELDEANARALLDGLKKISRHLDNIVVASCHGVKGPAGWRIIELG